MTQPAAFPMPTDAEVIAYIEKSNQFYPPNAHLLSMQENRYWYDRYAQEMRADAPKEVATTDFQLAAAGPPRDLQARRYHHVQWMPQRGATVLYIHGGGFLLGGLDSHADVCVGLCQGTGLDVIAIAYRLAPENLHPSQLDDVEAAYAFLVDHGARVILAGDSAGANLAAALCLRLRRKQLPQPCGQVLIYPGLGGDMSQGSYVSNRHAPMLSTEESKYYFDIRTGGQTDRDSSQDAELLPLRALDFSGLAPAYVVTADIDPLRDDGADYVERLQAAGVAAQLRNEPQLVHGYLRARHISQRAAASFSSICAAIARMADGTFQTA